MKDNEPELFDLDRLERLWRTRDAFVPAATSAESPVDQKKIAHAACERLRLLLSTCFSEHRAALAPFLDDISRLIEATWGFPGLAGSAARELRQPNQKLAPQDAAKALVAEVEELEELVDALLLAARER